MAWFISLHWSVFCIIKSRMVRIITQYGTLLGIKRKRLILFTEIFSTLRKWQEHSFLVDYLTKVIHGKTIPPNFISFSINPPNKISFKEPIFISLPILNWSLHRPCISFSGSWWWNRHNHGQTIHPTKNSISMNLLQMSCVITWARSFLTS